MSQNNEFSFAGGSIAENYDTILVPVLFHPWALELIKSNEPWEGKQVLDLAAGTGVVAEQIVGAVGPNGSVVCVDISEDMLAIAKKRCEGLIPEENYIVCSASPLDIESERFDRVVCQQGLQFFPEKESCIREMYRVLKPGGQVILSTWCEVEKCQLIGAACRALEQIGQQELSDKLRIPFDHMPQEDLVQLFEKSHFVNVRHLQKEKDVILEGGYDEAIQMLYATPIGPDLMELPSEDQERLKRILVETIKKYQVSEKSMGLMVSNVVIAEKE